MLNAVCQPFIDNGEDNDEFNIDIDLWIVKLEYSPVGRLLEKKIKHIWHKSRQNQSSMVNMNDNLG